MVGPQIPHQNTSQQQADGVAEAKLDLTEHQRNGADQQSQHKEGGEGHEIRGLTVNADKADLVGQQFDPLLLAADLQHVAFLQHDVAIERHLDLGAHHPVEEAPFLGEVELHQMAAYHGVILYHYLFGDDLQVKQVAVKHLFTVAIVDVQLLVALGIAHQGDLVPFLNNGITIGTGQNAVAADPLYIATGMGIDAGLSQGTTTYPGCQLGANPIGADDGQIGLATLAVGEPPLAGDFLCLGIEVEACQRWEIAHHQHQAHQTHQIGQGVADAHVV